MTRHNRLRLALPALLALLAGLGAACSDDEGGQQGDTGADVGPDAPDPNLLLHVPSPDWSEQVIYFVMTDRFNDGDPTNNDQGEGEYDPEDFRKYSGGDLQGIIDQLDYIQGLGATAIWITPPVANLWWDPLSEFGGYHGYWGRHFKEVDEHLGTLDTYRELSDALHRRGMVLIQDIVPNHTGNFFTWTGAYDPEDPAENFLLNAQAVPSGAPTQAPFDMNDVTNSEHFAAAIYHWTPAIADFTDREQELTWQISDLDDLNTENPVVMEALRDSYGFWIREVGVDGFRIDTAKFIDHPFWRDFIHSTDADVPGLEAVAEATGRDAFLTFGEVYEVSEPLDDSGEQIASSYLGTDDEPELRSVLGFPLYEEIGRVFAGGGSTAWMGYRLERFMDETLFPNPHLVPNFVDNHDVARFLQGGTEAGLRQALAFLMTVPGIPVIYYGTEQAFAETRMSMFAEGWGSGGEAHFDVEAPLYVFISELTALRAANPALTLGDLTVLADNPAGPGLLAYRREHEAGDLFVIFNTADEPVLAELDTGLESGARLRAEMNIGLAGNETVRDDGTLLKELPGRSAVVYLATGNIGTPPAVDATITIDTEIDGQTFTENVAVRGSVEPAGTALVMVLDSYLDTATPLTVAGDGSFTATIPVAFFPIGVSQHTVVFYAADANAASPVYEFTADVVFEGEILEVEDPEGDDTGPEGTYTYPQDATFGSQMDVTHLTIEAGVTSLTLKLTMAETSTVWNPSNGFDHVAFTIFFDLPGEEGLTVLPRINATAPEAFAWDFTHFAFGWSNDLYNNVGADATEPGTPVAGSPTIFADVANDVIAFTYDRTKFGIESWEGVSVYVTTWDYDGIDNRYRLLSEDGGQWVMGGGAEDDPFIMDDVGPVLIPVAEE